MGRSRHLKNVLINWSASIIHASRWRTPLQILAKVATYILYLMMSIIIRLLFSWARHSNFVTVWECSSCHVRANGRYGVWNGRGRKDIFLWSCVVPKARIGWSVGLLLLSATDGNPSQKKLFDGVPPPIVSGKSSLFSGLSWFFWGAERSCGWHNRKPQSIRFVKVEIFAYLYPKIDFWPFLFSVNEMARYSTVTYSAVSQNKAHMAQKFDNEPRLY